MPNKALPRLSHVFFEVAKSWFKYPKIVFEHD